MKKSLISFFVLFFIILFIWQKEQDVSTKEQFNFYALKKLPVQHQGRLKPLDSVARNSLLILRGNQTLSKTQPIEWLAKLTMNVKESSQLQVFRIDHPGLLSIIDKKTEDGKYFSYQDMEIHIETISKQAFQAINIEEKLRDSYQNAAIELWEKIVLYNSLSHTFFMAATENPLQETQIFEKNLQVIRFLPQNNSQLSQPDFNTQYLFQRFFERYRFLARTAQFQVLYPQSQNEGSWKNMGQGLLDLVSHPSKHPAIDDLLKMVHAFQNKDSAAFNKHLYVHIEKHKKLFPMVTTSIFLETFFNDFEPFYLSIILYTISFMLIMFSCLILRTPLQSISYHLLLIAFIIHTIGMVCRMYIEGRPPVTNLYSSAIFVGWSTVFLGIVIEWIFRNGVASSVAAAVGGVTLIIAHHLATTGDTMEPMRAVLNSNFWLSTHVVTISFGYSSAFLAGFIACGYTLRQFLPPSLEKKDQRSIEKIVYGVICFSTFFSFIGTVLGGIWADQSWGRFWGWDPKENGALMIVLWNALILHARWGNLVKTQGIMLLAIFGNVITSFSWFGVNMLGVGLHSYGFIENSFYWLIAFIMSQLFLIVLSLSIQWIKSLNSQKKDSYD